MNYRKHIMPSDISPSELFKAVEIGTDLAEVGMDCISRHAAIIQLSHNKIGDDDCDVIIQRDIETIKQLPPAEPVIAPCDYVKACNEATMDKLTSAVLYLDVLEELKKHGYVLVDMRGDNMRYCRINGRLCVFATEYGYCSFTVCREVTT